MSLIEWTPEYSVGVAEIDEQHKKMFATVNNLYDAIHAKGTTELLRKFIQEMVDYADYHFSTEEKYFEKFKYHEKDEHIKTHNVYRERVLKYVKEFEENKEFLSFEILDFLEDWWLGHIAKVDKRYMDFFHFRGLW
jgi:hemerythrin